MGETLLHVRLVTLAYECVRSRVPAELSATIQCDLPGFRKPERVFHNYIPDVLFWNDETLIIGEAKTFGDFERRHSREQFDAYLTDCLLYPCSTLVVGVPWRLVATAKNYFRRMKRSRKLDFPIVVLNEYNMQFEI